MAAYRLAGKALDLVSAYESDLWDIGQLPDHKVLWGARWFLVHVGEPHAFTDLSLQQQLSVNSAVHRFVAWLIAAIWWSGGHGWASACRGTGRCFMPCS
jgi:hypothetical protein